MGYIRIHGVEQNTRRQALLERNKGRVCKTPFVRFDVWRDGSVPVCCTDWMQGDVIIGNVFKQSPEEIWNSAIAKRIRKSVTDGSFAYCTEKCPFLADARLPLKVELPTEERLIADNPEADLKHPPRFIKLVNDQSCNLSCPSCRNEVVVETKSDSDMISAANMRVVYPMLKEARVLDVLGNGEALASKSTMRLLEALDAETHRNLTIDLLTNGTHFNEKAWMRLRNIHPLSIRLNVSADGATQQTFEKLRRGAKWGVFNQNLAFISDLRHQQKIKMLTINCTIQVDNYRELPLLADMARKYNADRVFLFRFMPWPHMSRDYVEANDIFDVRHPLHEDFRRVVRDFSDPIVEIGPLAVFA